MEFTLKTPFKISPEVENECIDLAAKENKLVALRFIMDKIERKNFRLKEWKDWIDERDPLIRAIKENKDIEAVANFSYHDMINFAKYLSEVFDIRYDYSSPPQLIKEFLDKKRDGYVFKDNMGK